MVPTEPNSTSASQESPPLDPLRLGFKLVTWEKVLVAQSCNFASPCSDSLLPPWTVACQAPLSIEFSMQEYWSG